MLFIDQHYRFAFKWPILKSTLLGMAVLPGFSVVMSRIARVLGAHHIALPTHPWLITFTTSIPLTVWVFLTFWLTCGLCRVGSWCTTN